MKSVKLGGGTKEHVEISVSGYERAPTGDYHDDNWVLAAVSIHAGAFRGRYSASFQAADFEGFHNQLAALYSTLRGEAVFETIEEQLHLSLKGNGLGHIALSGMAIDLPGTGNTLEFTLELDQTQLANTLDALAALIATYPVRT